MSKSIYPALRATMAPTRRLGWSGRLHKWFGGKAGRDVFAVAEKNWWFVYLNKLSDSTDEERRKVERLYGFDQGSLGGSGA